jgi:YD repeat-containing protein
VRVEDDLGRSYRLEYDEDGLLEKVADFSGRDVLYHYDPLGRLRSVESPMVTSGLVGNGSGRLSTTYDYDTTQGSSLTGRLVRRDQLSGIIDSKGQRWLSIVLTDADSDERPEELTQAVWGSGSLAVEYDFDARTASVLDRRAKPWSYEHHPGGQVKALVDPANSRTELVVDAEGLTTQSTSPLGRVTEFTYDEAGGYRSRGNLVSTSVVADARGANGTAEVLTTQIAYHPSSNLPRRIEDPQSGVTEIQRLRSGLPTSITRGLGTPDVAQTSYAYNDFGQVETLTSPNQLVTQYDYFEQGPAMGMLESTTADPTGLAYVTRFERDSLGRVEATIDAAGVRSETDYNEVGWMVEQRSATAVTDPGHSALGYATRYRYDANGNAAETYIPYGDGSTHTKTVRSHGLLDEVESMGREVSPGGGMVETTYGYDAALNVTTVTGPEGRVTETVYDDRGLVATKEPSNRSVTREAILGGLATMAMEGHARARTRSAIVTSWSTTT